VLGFFHLARPRIDAADEAVRIALDALHVASQHTRARLQAGPHRETLTQARIVWSSSASCTSFSTNKSAPVGQEILLDKRDVCGRVSPAPTYSSARRVLWEGTSP